MTGQSGMGKPDSPSIPGCQHLALHDLLLTWLPAPGYQIPCSFACMAASTWLPIPRVICPCVLICVCSMFRPQPQLFTRSMMLRLMLSVARVCFCALALLHGLKAIRESSDYYASWWDVASDAFKREMTYFCFWLVSTPARWFIWGSFNDSIEFWRFVSAHPSCIEFWRYVSAHPSLRIPRVHSPESVSQIEPLVDAEDEDRVQLGGEWVDYAQSGGEWVDYEQDEPEDVDHAQLGEESDDYFNPDRLWPSDAWVCSSCQFTSFRVVCNSWQCAQCGNDSFTRV